GEDGLSLCRSVRAESRIPVIMLTAKGDEVDRVIGLEMGADDYLPKPFGSREHQGGPPTQPTHLLCETERTTEAVSLRSLATRYRRARAVARGRRYPAAQHRRV